MSNRTIAVTSILALGVMTPSIVASEPVVDWETTISFTAELEGADDMVVDAMGNAIVTGNLAVEGDFFVAKLDSAGALTWSRIIGGSGLDNVSGIAVDHAGDVYLAGRSLSSDFPTVNAYQDTKVGPSDAILMKLNGDDGSTAFSTYFGGSRGEWAFGVALDPAGNIVITGQTDSTNFETVNAIQDLLTLEECFCDDAFVTRFSPDGDAVLFSTYLGGAFDDVGSEIAVDGDGNIVFTGRTKSANFPTLNAAQPAHGGGAFDVFIARIGADDTLHYSTYLGGEAWDLPQGMDVGGDGAAFVTGSTQSIAFPTTAGAFQEVFVGGILSCEVPFSQDRNCHDMFVTRIEPSGALGYSTYIGGSQDDEPRDIVVDAAGRAHVIGYTFSNDFPMDTPFGSVVAMRLDADGAALDFAVTHATPGPNAGSAIAVRGGDLWIASSVGLPYDTFVARFDGVTMPADVDGDGAVGIADLLMVIGAWGTCPARTECDGDVDGDGAVGVADLLEVLEAWGAQQG